MFDPERFILAQKDHYAQAIAELHNGRKTTHWMWFIFPQLKGLGQSKTANYFGIDDIDAAKSYLEHIELGPRLIHASNVILLKSGSPIVSILGKTDGIKLRSSATLFALACHEPIFSTLIRTFYDGQQCEKTIKLLKNHQDTGQARF